MIGRQPSRPRRILEPSAQPHLWQTNSAKRLCGPSSRDVVDGKYSDIHLASFVTACATRPLDHREILALTKAMVEAGDRLSWKSDVVVDKHSVGGLPGNRTTPIIVPIVAALGLTMPKTSSRAITSPAGTADTMETMAPVELDIADIHRVVEQEGGCIAWGGAVRLSPADDVIIRIERALDIDTEGQMIASVLSKKIAAGSTHLVLDVPVGPTAKVRTPEAANALSAGLIAVAEAFGIRAEGRPSATASSRSVAASVQRSKPTMSWPCCRAPRTLPRISERERSRSPVC